MKAMILAAGRGERMRPLTDTTPKPLLKVASKELIVWHIEKLAKNGFEEIVINIAHIGDQIPKALGDGSRWGVKLAYSDEQTTGALETAGGIKQALELLGDEPFLVINGDVFCEYEFDPNFDLKEKLIHLILIPNPPHNQTGDFGFKDSLVLNSKAELWTFSGIAYYNPVVFQNVKLEKSPLAPLLRQFIEQQKVSGEIFQGLWKDIGTPERLNEINETYSSSN